jgi:hypothetical protein
VDEAAVAEEVERNKHRIAGLRTVLQVTGCRPLSVSGSVWPSGGEGSLSYTDGQGQEIRPIPVFPS